MSAGPGPPSLLTDYRFYEAISRAPRQRSNEDIRCIYERLRQLDAFATLYSGPLKAIAAQARFLSAPANHTLFREGDVADSWYILLTGSVLFERHFYLPYACFGKRNGLNYRRTGDCLVLQDADMVVIDYPDVQCVSSSSTSGCLSTTGHLQQQQQTTSRLARSSATASTSSSSTGGGGGGANGQGAGGVHRMGAMRRSHAPPPSNVTTQSVDAAHHCDASSSRAPPRQERAVDVPPMAAHRSQVYINGLTQHSHVDDSTLVRVKHRPGTNGSLDGNGGGTAAAVTAAVAAAGTTGPRRSRRVPSTASSSTETSDCLAGLPETTVDSEDDDDELSCPSAESVAELRDSVRDCLEREPAHRTAEDIQILMDFMQHMAAFSQLPQQIKRQICRRMVFAVVPSAGTVVLKDSEKLDAWSVIVNGQVEVVRKSGERVELKLGDWFGAEPKPVEQLHEGEMRTLVDDCQFVLVEQRDFCRIMATVTEHIEREADGVTGEVVGETERRTVGSQTGLLLIKGKPDKLVQHLVEDRDAAVDPHYTEDFLLMYRVFIRDPLVIFEKLMLWFAEPHFRDKVARVVLLWVNNHFLDFETNLELIGALERFEAALERERMLSQQQLLNIACAVKARPRTVKIERASRTDPLNFTVMGGKDAGFGIFVADLATADDVASATAAGGGVSSTGRPSHVRRGDEILEANGQSLRQATLARAIEILRAQPSVELVVRHNMLGFKELVALGANDNNMPPTNGRFAKRPAPVPNGNGAAPSASGRPSAQGGGASVSSTGKSRGVVDRLVQMLRVGSLRDDDPSCSDPRSVGAEVRTFRGPLPDGHAQPIAHYYADRDRSGAPESPDHVVRVFRADQSCRYLAIFRETTAQNVVQLALQEFGMTSESGVDWALCETSVTPEGVIKQRRLPADLCDLAERLTLNSRYYLKHNSRPEPLVPDELAPELAKEARSGLLDLNAHVVAAQLTLQDFAIFATIEPTEYVDDLFQLNSVYGTPRLEQFAALFNREMYWVGTETCSERNVYRRAKLIKKFIKMARHCRDMRNFNSMFAIISGLDKPAVRRLHSSWERVASKYTKQLDEMQQLIDPSRNMSKYRQHLALVGQDPPVVPIYPVIKKDLVFSHEGNPTYSDKLVNFEKLRMIAKSVRSVTRLASQPYEVEQMAQQSGVPGMGSALLHLNNHSDGGSVGGRPAVATMRRAFGSATSSTGISLGAGLQNGAAHLITAASSSSGAVNSSNTSTSAARKKTYEIALMVRQVKAYLDQLQVVDSESELDALSAECEPPAPGAAVQAALRRRAPSPSPSSASSHSTEMRLAKLTAHLTPKFGVESPQAVQKMLSLVHNSRVKPSALNGGGGGGGAPFPTSASPSLAGGSDGARLLRRGVPAGGTSSSGGVLPSASSTSIVAGLPPRAPHPLRPALRPNAANLVDSSSPIDLTPESSSVTAFYAASPANAGATSSSSRATSAGSASISSSRSSLSSLPIQHAPRQLCGIIRPDKEKAANNNNGHAAYHNGNHHHHQTSNGRQNHHHNGDRDNDDDDDLERNSAVYSTDDDDVGVGYGRTGTLVRLPPVHRSARAPNVNPYSSPPSSANGNGTCFVDDSSQISRV